MNTFGVPTIIQIDQVGKSQITKSGGRITKCEVLSPHMLLPLPNLSNVAPRLDCGGGGGVTQ